MYLAASAAKASRLCSMAFCRNRSGCSGGFSASAMLRFSSDRPFELTRHFFKRCDLGLENFLQCDWSVHFGAPSACLFQIPPRNLGERSPPMRPNSGARERRE